MAETHRNGHKAPMKVPEFLREPFEAAQARLEAFEDEAQRVFKDLMNKGKASRKDFSELVQRLQKQDWHLPELKDRLEKLRETGVERAQEWRDRADTIRAEAMERLVELQSKAVNFLGVATREQVEELAREIDRLVKRMERESKPRRTARKPARKAAAPKAAETV